MGKNIDYLISETKKFEYISFDIFDTLLFRNVGTYKDIFYFVEEKDVYKRQGMSRNCWGTAVLSPLRSTPKSPLPEKKKS